MRMTLPLLAKLFHTVGTIFIAYAALRVHHRMLTEQKVDRTVLKEMRREQIAGILGVLLIVISFAIDVAVFI